MEWKRVEEREEREEGGEGRKEGRRIRGRRCLCVSSAGFEGRRAKPLTGLHCCERQQKGLDY